MWKKNFCIEIMPMSCFLENIVYNIILIFDFKKWLIIGWEYAENDWEYVED